MKISINCPSYKRKIVKTLNFIPQCKVWVAEEELEEYKKHNDAAFGVLSSQGNISKVRNEILDKEFAAGADVVCMLDDDMQGIYHYERKGNFGYDRKPVKDMGEFIYKHTTMAQDLGVYLWGVNVNKDPRAYRHSNPISTTSIILGPFSCHLKGTEIRYDEKIPLKEDYDLAIQHMDKYRGILRMNKFHYICEQSTIAGGCSSIRNLETEKAQFEILQNKWGSKIIRKDKGSKKAFDYNPIVKVPIKGV